MSSTIAQAALEYLQRHWSVIPVLPFEKRPAIRWMAFQNRYASEDEVRGWFEQWPTANVGIVTGAISGLVVLDIDPKHGGNASLAELVVQHGPFPHSIEALTGGGGRHIYFSHPGGLVRNKAGIMAGMDLRGDGGFIVAPPSVHESGNLYSWTEGHSPRTVTPAPMPAWLLQMVMGQTQRHGHVLAYWRNLLKEGVPEGERNNTIASLAGHLLWHGVDPDVVQELLLCWNHVRCRPPLTDDEVVRTVDSITRLHESND
jgi:hypothetical protein